MESDEGLISKRTRSGPLYKEFGPVSLCQSKYYKVVFANMTSCCLRQITSRSSFGLARPLVVISVQSIISLHMNTPLYTHIVTGRGGIYYLSISR